MRTLVALILAVVTCSCAGQDCTTDTAWTTMRALIGRWSGTSEGEPGKGTVQRTVGPALHGAFIRLNDEGEFPPQEKNPKGEHHADEGFITLDRSTKEFRLKQYHQGGILNEFKVDSISADGRTIVLTTERVENFMPGWRSRLTWNIEGDQWTEVFDVAPPNKPWMNYMRILFTRMER